MNPPWTRPAPLRDRRGSGFGFGVPVRDYAAAPMLDRTTIVVQRYLDAMADDANAERDVRELLERAARRLHLLGSGLLHRSYPRLARPPLNLNADELLSSVVARLLQALRAVRPSNVRQFFALANKHMRWELNDLARRLDENPLPLAMEGDVAQSPDTPSPVTPRLHRILQAIEELPDDERETFSFVRIQDLSHAEVAELLGVSTKTVQRRLHRSLVLLSSALQELRPPE